MEITPRSRVLCSYRILVVFIAFLGYGVLYMQRVDLGIAILCMVNNTAVNLLHQKERPFVASNQSVLLVNETSSCSATLDDSKSNPDGEFVWPKQLQGLLLASFFYGYLPSMMLGGYLAAKFGPVIICAISIGFSSIGTVLLPFAARWNLPALFVCRILIGVAQGFYLPSIGGLWVTWIPKKESSRLIGSSVSGIFLGTAIALPIGGYFCSTIGWPSIFYVKGITGIAWVIIFLLLVKDNPQNSRCVRKNEKRFLQKEIPEQSNTTTNLHTPWLKIITSKVVLAQAFCFIAFNWTNYLYLTQIPTYVKEVIKLDIRSNGIFTALPYISTTFVNLIGGIVADALINKKIMSTLVVRRLYTCLGFFGAAACLVGLSFVQCTSPYIGIALLTIGFTFTGLIFCGGFSLDLFVIAGPFTSIVVGFATAIGNLSGIVAPYVVAAITVNKKQSEWRWVFWLGSLLSVLGAIVYIIFGDQRLQKWAEVKNKHQEEEMTELNK